MGILKVVTGADYQAQAVGRFFFDTNIFRRKINGALERNYINIQRSVGQGYQMVDLSKTGHYKIRVNIYKNTDPIILFSVFDYVNRKAFWLSVSDTGLFYIRVSRETDFATNTSTVSNRSWNAGSGFMVPGQEYTIEVDIDTSSLEALSFKFNGVERALIWGGANTSTGAYTNGQTRTIGIGVTANATTDGDSGSPAVGIGKVSFCQLSHENEILLHYDFLGDNLDEVLTDKVGGIRLVTRGSFLPVSVPISI